MQDRHAYWESVYATRKPTDVSWYQTHADRSLEFIRAAATDRAVSIVDVGGGASTLVDDLVADGYSDVTVLDISELALAQAKARLGAAANRVAWIAADITVWQPARTWNVWHDRAVFHFLVEKSPQDAYIAALLAATAPGATAILATFALDGPDKCSGLPVQRYSAQRLAERLGPSFHLESEAAERHRTPAGAEQRFIWAVFRRR